MGDYDAILFDSDGILVEPPAYDTKVEATRKAFAELGITAPASEHVDDLVHGTTVNRLQKICERYDLHPEAFWEARERHDEQSQFEKFNTGARSCYEDVAVIAEIPQPRGIVSNNHHSTIAFVLEFFGLDSLFDCYYGREKTIESLDRKKPNTHYLDRALDDLGAASALFIGDSENDLIAARRSGIDSAFLRRAHCRDVELDVQPTYDVQSLHDLVRIVA